MIKPKESIQDIEIYKTDKYKSEWRLKLDANENIYGCNVNILNTIKNLSIEDIYLYPCYGELIDKLMQRYCVNEQNLLLTNGCDEALNIIISTYIDKNDEMMSYNPSFSMPMLYAKAAGGEVKTINYSEKFVFCESDFTNNISEKTKIVYLATPNNPTGEVVRASVAERLVQKYPNVLFIIDCTYTNYSYSVTFEDYIDLAKKYNNIAVVKSFSKDFGLAGLRLGMVIADDEIISNLKKTISPFSVNSIALNCAINAIKEEDKFEQIKKLNLEAKQLLEQGLNELGYKYYKSEANFVLCDFGNYSDFYYEKLKKNGVIVRSFSKNSPISSCLRITVPKVGGVKYILELLKTKDLLIFDLDGVVFDVSESYLGAIKETFKHFAGYEVELDEILEVKNLGGNNCDWDATKCLLSCHGIEVELSDVIDVFQDLFYNPDVKKDNYLIDKEKLLVQKEVFENLSVKYDMVVFSGRLKAEADYSLKKFGIDKYFYYYVTADDLPQDKLKPDPEGVLRIKLHCPYNSIKYLGDSVDDVIAGKQAQVTTVGVISPEANYSSMKNNFKHLGANHILDNIKKLENFLLEKEDEFF